MLNVCVCGCVGEWVGEKTHPVCIFCVDVGVSVDVRWCGCGCGCGCVWECGCVGAWVSCGCVGGCGWSLTFATEPQASFPSCFVTRFPISPVWMLSYSLEAD